MISKESIAHVADLARLRLDDTELAAYTAQLDEILNMVAQLEAVDTTNVPVTTQSGHWANVMREDVAAAPTPVEALLANVPTTKDTLIQVPAILDNEEA